MRNRVYHRRGTRRNHHDRQQLDLFLNWPPAPPMSWGVDRADRATVQLARRCGLSIHYAKVVAALLGLGEAQ
jgi:hypothetical protein